jgi:hypothetical protein
MNPATPEIIAQYATVLVGSLAALSAIGVAVHAYLRRARRAERRTGALPPLDDDRLARLEQAVDAIAIEVERIAEGQRFLTKLQSEQGEHRSLPR